MAKWSAGFKWEPSGQSAPSLWGEVDAGVGYPDVIINGLNYCDVVASVRWRTGRDWWFADPEGGTGQVTLWGWLTQFSAGQPVVISADPVGPLWTGWVDTVSLDATPDGQTTTLGLVDVLAKIGQLDLVGLRPLNYPQQAITQRVGMMAQTVGDTVPVLTEAADTFLPQVKAQANYTGSLIGLLADVEKASNAIVAVDNNGSLLVQPRAAVSGGTPPVTWLENEACPSRITRESKSTDRIINSWQLGAIVASTIPGNDDPTSIGKYGRHAYNVPDLSVDPLWSNDPLVPGVYFAGITNALHNPVDTLVAEVPVKSRTNPVVALHPYDWVAYSGTYYQVMSMDWTADPDDWRVTLGLDPTQDTIGGRPDGPTPPEPPTTETVTETWACKADASAVRTSGGVNAGNGASDRLLAGLLSDGTLARALLNFTAGWNLAKVVSVTKATLVLYTTTYTCLSQGSRRTMVVHRITAGWSEGSYAVQCGFASSNAVVYPGPAVTSSGEKSSTCPAGDSVKWSIDITDIVRAWAAGSPMYGVRIRGSSETSTADRVEVSSRSFGTSARRPTLVVTYVREV